MSKSVSIVSVVGARPQFIKLAPVCRALERLCPEFEHRIVHTGQHYDANMSRIFFDELQIPRPDLDLEIGSGSHGSQTGAMLAALDTEFSSRKPDAVVVYGDTNSTLAATLAASKLQIPVVHIEAGLRSFNRAMPEEINRLVADHCADRLYVPTAAGMENVKREGLTGRSVRVGDVMYDAVLHNRKISEEKSRILDELGLRADGYGVLTIHRPSNTDEGRLGPLLTAFSSFADTHLPLVFPLHPRTRSVIDDMVTDISPNLRLTSPMSYLDMLKLLGNARLIMTDSGGVQKEAAFLNTPCITVRDETEWPETVNIGANTIAGSDPATVVEQAVRILAGDRPNWQGALERQYGGGDAADRIVLDMRNWMAGMHGQTAAEQ